MQVPVSRTFSILIYHVSGVINYDVMNYDVISHEIVFIGEGLLSKVPRYHG